LKIEISTPNLACLTDSNTITDEAWLQRLGQRLAQLRLAKNLTQAQLAEQAGLGLRTVQRLELGASATQLSGFLRVCRVLGLVERLDLLVPEAVASPMAQLKQAVRKRRRASGKKVPFSLPGPWTWGERA
jgi:transcriptional regulator with XRE-family HTH domain